MLMNEYIIQHVNIRQLMQATNNAGHEYREWLRRSQQIFFHKQSKQKLHKTHNKFKIIIIK